jgi:class 3 adenylate cyclase
MELRLYLEDLCCDLCRFEHLAEGIPPEEIRIRQEVDLGIPGAFADACISLPGGRKYFVEVALGNDRDEIADRVARYYGLKTCVSEKAQKVRIVVADYDSELSAIESDFRALVSPHLEVEVWTASHLRESILRHFKIELKQFERENLLALRSAVEKIKGTFAYGDGFTGSAAQLILMWHLGCWTIRRVQQEAKLPVEAMMRKGLYRDTAILIADLSGFSGYVRDSPEDSVVQNALASFYTKTRREVINYGSMISQFVGDSVIAVFGVPVLFPDYIERALECGVSIMDIGKSVSASWQSHIDRLQSVSGCHTGIALGDVHIVPLRSYSHSHMGLVADAVNMAARLSAAAQPGDIVVSNAFYQRLGKASRIHFVETDPIEAKNVGRLCAWRWKQVGPNSVQNLAHAG